MESPETPPAPELETSGTAAQAVTAEALNERVQMPVVDESAIAASLETAPAGNETSAKPAAPAPTPGAVFNPHGPKPGDLDAKGRKFNPDSFLPEKDSRGWWKSKGAGRPAKVAPAKVAPASMVGSDKPDAPPVLPSGAAGDRFDAAAELYTRTFYGMADAAFAGGGEWLPENDGEHAAFRQSVAAYLRHKGTDDLPPGLALAFAVCSYSGKRVTKPNTQTRLRLYFQWIKAKWGAWRFGQKNDKLSEMPIREEEKSALPPRVDLNGKTPHLAT